MPWGAVIGAVGAIGGAAIAAGSASDAADAQSQSAANATAEGARQYDQTRADYQPYRDAGYSALGKLSDMLGLSGNTGASGYGSLNKRFTGADLQNEPGYQFGLDEGTKNLQNSAAARGGLYSGDTLKRLTKYDQDYAGTKYGDAYNRFKSDQDTAYNRLAGVSGTGQTATNQVAQAGENYTNNAQSNLIGAGNARGSSYIAQGNALQNGINGAANAFGGYMNSPSSAGSSVSNGSIFRANMSDDPIGSLGSSQGWWSQGS